MSAKLARLRYFTAAAANRMLPLVRAIVEDVVDLNHDLSDRKQRLHDLRGDRELLKSRNDSLYTEEVEQMERDLERDSTQLKAYIRELEELGVNFEDTEQGLVDFPTMIDGKNAVLCWRLGEPEVAYWHLTEGNDLKRRSLTDGSVQSTARAAEV